MREKTFYKNKYLELGFTTNMFMFGVAYDARDLFIAIGPLLITIDFSRKRKHK